MPQAELLAPAGNLTCLHAAVRAGADAVYLGVEDFNARRGADNFTLDALASACDWAHLRGVRIYLTLNTIILPSEFDRALELARQGYLAGVDAFIVQDIGLAHRMRTAVPEAHLHISTQMNTHSEAGIRAAAQLGATRVTLARELSYAEIDNLCSCAHELGMQIEAFAHGALCICYSGQCFASSMVGGRSANRGMCAQACRLPYTLHNCSTNRVLPSDGEHLLSPKDLCTIDVLPELLACGVDSLKIEGRMKSPEYVHAVVSTYRAVLDRALGVDESTCGAGEAEGESFATVRATDAERRSLDEAFSRGFTTAYLDADAGPEMMSFGRPNNRGAFLGRVARVGGGSVDVDCELSVENGDVLEFWTGKGHFTHVVDTFEDVGKGRVRLPVTKRVGKGDRVFRVRSAAAAFQDNDQEPRVPVQARVVLRIGEPARMELALAPRGLASALLDDVLASDQDAAERRQREQDACASWPALEGIAVAVEGDVVEPARTKALVADEVRVHIDRFGSTPFQLAAMQIELQEGAGMGFSQLHALRAQAADALVAKILEQYRARTLVRQPKLSPVAVVPQRTGCDVCVLATNPACARAARKAGADAVYVPVLNYRRGQSCVAGQLSDTVEQAGYPNRAIPVLPTVEHDMVCGAREYTFDFDAWKYAKPGKPVLADNMGQIKAACELGCLVEAGHHVPVTNAAAAALLQEWGVQRIWMSPELTLGQIQQIAEQVQMPLGLAIIGQQELMVTEHCLLSSQGPCDRACATCPRRKSPHYLKDRKGYEMPVVTDCCGRSHLYNAVSLDIAHAAGDLVAAGIRAFMVDATLMTVEQTRAATARAVRARDLALRGAGSVARAEGTTTGHLFRSIS